MFGYVVNMTTNIKHRSLKNNTIFLSNNLTCVNIWSFQVSYLKPAWKNWKNDIWQPCIRKIKNYEIFHKKICPSLMRWQKWFWDLQHVFIYSGKIPYVLDVQVAIKKWCFATELFLTLETLLPFRYVSL